jgi:hypothetical protein
MFGVTEDDQVCEGVDRNVGILVDEDDLVNYQLVISYRLLIRILTNQSTVDLTIVLSTNC